MRGTRSATDLALTVLLTVVVFTAGCASQGVRTTIERLETAGIVREIAASKTVLDVLYDTAIVDSAVFRAEHAVGDLRPVIGPTDMTSLMSCDCPNGWCSAKCSLQIGSQKARTDIWVARADQELEFCNAFPRHLTKDQVILKLQQLLGLPPQTTQDPCTWQILKVKVDNLRVPEEFFRPCPDPDPTTTGPCPAELDRNNANGTQEFRAWMAGQAFSAWKIPDGYPWTHLGYTYNWDPDAANIVGVSEYVIARNAPIEITGREPAVEFCTQKRLTCD